MLTNNGFVNEMVVVPSKDIEFLAAVTLALDEYAAECGVFTTFNEHMGCIFVQVDGQEVGVVPCPTYAGIYQDRSLEATLKNNIKRIAQTIKIVSGNTDIVSIMSLLQAIKF